jgi:signal transduction histidine kinase
MYRGRYSRPAPFWWPEGEPWPPRDAGARWRRRRFRFIGRVWILLAAIWWLSGLGAFSIFSRMADRSSGFWTDDRVWSLVVALLVGAFAVAFVAVVQRVIAPIGDIVGAAQRVADGDLTARVTAQGPPAVRAVATAFNDMAGRLAAQERQRRELMADIAHELRTPLSIVQGRLEGLIDGVYPRDATQLEPLLDETRVLARLVEDLRTLANAESGVLTLDREPTDIGMLMRDAAAAVRDEAAKGTVAVSVLEDAPAIVATVDPVRLRQVLVNLIANAVRHGGSGTAVTVRAAVDNGTLVVRVADTGPGIPTEELPHIFERFHKRRGSSGSGLGLTIARTLVRAHGGEIVADSRTGAGTTMTIRLPEVR